MKYPDIVHELSKEMFLKEEVIDTIYKSFYNFIRESITNLPLKEELHCTYERYLKMKKQKEYLDKLKDKI